MAKGQLWETRPLEFWAKAKELRAGWQKSIESKEKVIAQGNSAGLGFGYSFNWAEAFPALTIIEDNPVGAMMQNKNAQYARKARLASEIRGWGREICGYQGTCWGSQFLGYLEDDTPWPKRKMVLPFPARCGQHIKRGQQARDFENIPQWNGDQAAYYGPFDAERNAPMLEHRVYCGYRVINDIERIFGQKFDDGAVDELRGNMEVMNQYARDITTLMGRTIPTPLSVKDLYSVYTIGGLTKVDPQATLDFWKSVRDEVKWRADNHIAAVGNERFRWMEAHPPSWHFMKYYRYMEHYGAVCIGSEYSHMMASTQKMKLLPNGTIDFGDGGNMASSGEYPADTPILTREDACRLGAGIDVRWMPNWELSISARVEENLIDFAEVMQADGALLAVWRHGEGCTQLRKQQGMLLKNAGLSVIHYEGSQPGDRTDLDEKRLLDQLDNWMQSLGLQKDI